MPHPPPPTSSLSILSPTAPHSPSCSIKPAEKPRQLGFQKARKLSRVFTEITLLDSLVGRKSVDSIGAGQISPRKSSPVYTDVKSSVGLPHKRPSIQNLTLSLTGKRSRPTSPTSSVRPLSTLMDASTSSTPRSAAIPDAKLPNEIDFQSLTQPTVPSTPQIQPHLLPEQTPLPLSRPGSSRGSYGGLFTRRHRKSLDLTQLDEFGVKVTRLSRSKSLRISSFSDLASPKSSTAPSVDTRDIPAPPETIHKHYIEVKRARKMTQLFGQELPPELIRVLGEQKNVDTLRDRTDSTASSALDSIPVTPTVEASHGVLDEENVWPPSPPKVQCADFQERRRRVAKLTQFFGVNHAEIASSIMFAKSDGQRAASIDGQASLMEPVGVGVKVVSGRRWGFGQNMKDVEMSDAITKLRCLKAN